MEQLVRTGGSRASPFPPARGRDRCSRCSSAFAPCRHPGRGRAVDHPGGQRGLRRRRQLRRDAHERLRRTRQRRHRGRGSRPATRCSTSPPPRAPPPRGRSPRCPAASRPAAGSWSPRPRAPVAPTRCPPRTPPARSTSSGTAGTIALVHSTTALTCKTAADCAADSDIVDLVGWGGAVVHEGTAAGATSNTTSVQRADSLADTDDNGADFTVAAPTPTNSGTGGGGATPGPLRIHDIQGTSFLSPQRGAAVTNVPGIVTARAHDEQQGLLAPGPERRRQPGHQRGCFRVHQLDPDRRGRRQRARQRHGQRLLSAGQRRDHEHHLQPVDHRDRLAVGHHAVHRQCAPGSGGA